MFSENSRGISACRTSGAGAHAAIDAERESVADLFLDSGQVTIRDRIGVVGGAEGIPPLLLGELRPGASEAHCTSAGVIIDSSSLWRPL